MEIIFKNPKVENDIREELREMIEDKFGVEILQIDWYGKYKNWGDWNDWTPKKYY